MKVVKELIFHVSSVNRIPIMTEVNSQSLLRKGFFCSGVVTDVTLYTILDGCSILSY